MKFTTYNQRTARHPVGHSRLFEMSFVMLLGIITRFLALAVASKQLSLRSLFSGGTEMGFMASSLLRGEGLGSPFGGHTGPTAMIGPAYPIFVASIFGIFGNYSHHAALALIIIQAAVSLLNLWLIMLLARQLSPNDSSLGHRASLIAGTFWAISLPISFMPAILWDTTFTACILTGVLVVFAKYHKKPSRQHLYLFCILCGFAYLVNPALLLVSASLVIWASLYGHRIGRFNPALAIATFLMVCSPWPIRNAVTMHTFIPIRECFGIELNMGNHAGSDGHMEESIFPLFNASELSEYNHVGEVQYVQHKARQAKAYIRANPLVFVDLTFKRFFRFWMGTGNRAGSILFAVSTVPSTLLGLLGIAFLWKQRRSIAIPFLLVCLLFPLPYYITHAEYKYRMTLDPMLLALSAYAIVSLIVWMRQRQKSLMPDERTADIPSSRVLVNQSFVSDHSGQAIGVAAASMLVLIACLGLAVDVGHLRYERRRLQQAADAAALAAGLELNYCGTSHACSVMQNAAKTALIENGYTPAAVVLNCAPSSNTGVVLTINNPSCATGSTDANKGNAGYVEVELSEHVSAYFAGVVGFNSFPISVRAEAGRAPAPCIYALDQRPLLSVLPVGGIPLNNGITVVGLANVTANCPIVDESTSLLDFNCAVGSVSATKIVVTGTNSLNLLCPVTPAPQFNSPTPTPADPLAYVLQNHPLPIPTNCPALSTTLQILDATPRVFTDGTVFCGGLVIGATANVTFQPGVYTFAPGNLLGVPILGGLTITAGAHVIGNGVTFYNVGPNLAVTGGIAIAGNVGPLGSISLIAPNSTNTVSSTINYQGILFIQDPNDTAPAVISASTAYNTTLEGALYFPKAAITYAVSGNSKFNILVAYDINFGVAAGGNTAYENSVFGNNYSQLTNGSPIPATASVLVQ